MKEGRMYSPKISDRFIPLLYRKAKQEGVPMTKLIDKIVEMFFAEEVPTISECSTCNPESKLYLDYEECYCTTCGIVVVGVKKVSLLEEDPRDYEDFEEDDEAA
jgi:hypothetical protein